jgi:isopenicillin N synthase-like dioxygenase
LAGTRSALEELVGKLRYALENIGFYFIKGHGVPQSLFNEVFAETERFRNQPLDRKIRLKRNQDNVG